MPITNDIILIIMIDSATLPLQIGVKAFLKNRAGKYLMLLKSEPYPGDTKQKWEIPGGRIMVRETLRDALAREIKEETNLVLKGEPKILYAQDIIRDEKKHVVRLTFLASAIGEVKLDPKVHSDFGWFSVKEIKGLYHDVYLNTVLSLLK